MPNQWMNQMTSGRARNFFHLHMVSDATGETLLTVARAASARYFSVQPIEHSHPLIRSKQQLETVLDEIERTPGIVLYTLVDEDFSRRIDDRCAELGCPAVSILEPVLSTFQSYLGAEQTPRVGAQHVLDANYYRRIDALNYTLLHDDGQVPEGWNDADIILVGISRTSKTPTSIYLANRGYRTANVPMVPNIPLDKSLLGIDEPLIVGLIASAERIRQVRENRLLGLKAEQDTVYVDRIAIAEEIAMSRRFFQANGWPVIDVSRRSIEETAATVIGFHNARSEQKTRVRYERS